MITNLEVDQKTIAAFYEYHYYNVNEFIYGKIKVPHITYKRLLSTETSINEVIQSVQRELYNYEIDKKNFKTLIKKTVLLMKIYLNVKYHQYTFGYNNVSEKLKKMGLDSYDIKELIDELGHTEVIDEGYAATCTEKGLTKGKHCSRCGVNNRRNSLGNCGCNRNFF